MTQAAQPVAFAAWESPTLRVSMTPATDITGWTFQINVRRAGVVVLQSTTFVITDAANGVVSFTLTSAQTGAMSPGDYDYDVWRIDAGNEKRLCWGTMIVLTEQWK